MKLPLLIVAALAFVSTAALAEGPVTNVTPEAAQRLIQEKKQLQIIDVRTDDEFAAGHLKGSKNLDYSSGAFAKALPSLDPKAEYLVHCQSGARSSKAVERMRAAGFQHVYHMNGGFAEWRETQKPVETGAGAR